jgi:nucleoporin SEH1
LIATASKDRKVKIWKYQPLNKNVIASVGSNKALTGVESKIPELVSFEDHNCEVWRVEWNVTGTILASSGDDGNVYFFRSDFEGKWKCVGSAPPQSQLVHE